MDDLLESFLAEIFTSDGIAAAVIGGGVILGCLGYWFWSAVGA